MANRLSERYPQVASFVRAALPPLMSKYALVFLRVAAASPLGRALGLVVVLLAGLFVLVPAMLVFLLAWLASGDPSAAAQAALVVIAVGLLAIAWGGYWLYSRYRSWRKRKLQF